MSKQVNIYEAKTNLSRLVDEASQGEEIVIARHGHPVLIDGQEVGVVTSGSPSITLGTNIGLAYVPVGASRVGTALGIQIRDKVIDAVVVKTPFYKRQPR